jgi:hypothetical protein
VRLGLDRLVSRHVQSCIWLILFSLSGMLRTTWAFPSRPSDDGIAREN